MSDIDRSLSLGNILGDLAKIKHSRLGKILEVVAIIREEERVMGYGRIIGLITGYLDGKDSGPMDAMSIARVVKAGILIRLDSSKMFLQELELMFLDGDPTFDKKGICIQGSILGIIWAATSLRTNLSSADAGLSESTLARFLASFIFGFGIGGELESDVSGELGNAVKRYYGYYDISRVENDRTKGAFRNRLTSILHAIKIQAEAKASGIVHWKDVPVINEIITMITLKILGSYNALAQVELMQIAIETSQEAIATK